MGHRPTTPDTLPVIGPLPNHPSILLAFGHGQLGLTGAPLTGRIIGALAAGESLNIDLTPYRADRFA
jgi:D-amino-acid dehydrogenase